MRLLSALFQHIKTDSDTESVKNPHMSTLCEAVFSLVNEESKGLSVEVKQRTLESLLAADLALRCLGLSLWRQSPIAKYGTDCAYRSQYQERFCDRGLLQGVERFCLRTHPTEYALQDDRQYGLAKVCHCYDLQERCTCEKCPNR